jgi:hypothetical protein
VVHLFFIWTVWRDIFYCLNYTELSRQNSLILRINIFVSFRHIILRFVVKYPTVH